MIPVSHIKQQFSTELAFLILCCRLQLKKATAQELASYIKDHDPDWTFALRLAGHHGIRPIIYKVVATNPENVDPGFIKKLRAQTFLIAKDNLEHIRELVKVTTTFRQKGITIVPYKGLILGHLLFDDYGLRENSDIDMLILPQDFPVAKKTFIEMGYANTQYYNDDFEQYFIHTNREFKLNKIIEGNRKIKIELQWNPLHKLMGIPLTNKQLFKDLKQTSLPGGSAESLNLENELLLLFAHHGVADVWRKLKHLLDIAAFIDKFRDEIDWPAFEQLLKQNKLEKFAAAGCQMAELLFGVPAPVFVGKHNALGDAMLHGTLQYPLLSTEKTDLKHLSRHIRLYASLADKAGFISRYALLWLMPNMRDIEMIKLPRPLFPLYFIIRRFRFLQTTPYRK